MSNFTLTINTGNSAFQDFGRDLLLADLLRTAANRIDGYGETSGHLYDPNGNQVGGFLWSSRRVRP